MQYRIAIRAGRLAIATRREDLPLEALLDFASRQNPKRGFLFVSKVLGKHIPCRPRRMREVYERLAERLGNLPAPVLVMGMAETATGLGGGVADSLARGGRVRDLLYMHTTRHHLNRPRLLEIDERHSHAPEHILYHPRDELAGLFRAARTLVLVDDEISTGRTLALLAQRLGDRLPRLQEIVLAAIVNWLPPARQAEIGGGLRVPLRCASLLEGGFEFRPDPAYRTAPPAQVTARRPSRFARADTGRTGLPMPAPFRPQAVEALPAGPLVVVGTGEFAFQPFLLAEQLEQQGRDVLFQSTTRSPIHEGNAIRRKLTFADDHGEGVANYLYNLPSDRQAVVVYEHPGMAVRHALPALASAIPWSLG